MRIGEYGKKPNVRQGLALIAECVRAIADDLQVDTEKRVRALAVTARDRAARRVSRG